MAVIEILTSHVGLTCNGSSVFVEAVSLTAAAKAELLLYW